MEKFDKRITVRMKEEQLLFLEKLNAMYRLQETTSQIIRRLVDAAKRNYDEKEL